MARPRLPNSVAAISGAVVKNAGRFKGRSAPKGGAPIGGPSRHLDVYAFRAFQRFRRELPWLKESHRAVVELASMLRGSLLADRDWLAAHPELLAVNRASLLNLKTMQELRRCLGQLGATPADESRVVLPDGGDDDPDDAFFGRPN